MQIITRGEKESIVIDDEIIVTVIEIDGDDVLLSIDHPDDLPIEELQELQEVQEPASLF